MEASEIIYKFTEKELEEHDREVAPKAWNAAFNAIHHDDVDFETYWRERMEGEK